MAIRRQVLRDEAEEMILQKLLEGRYPAGARLSIDGLARELEVSPTPVREAMVALERSGLVSYTALRGYVVAPPLTVTQINELLDARALVEPAAMSKAFAHWEALTEQLAAAHAAHAEVVDQIERADAISYELVREHFQADWGFHQAVFNLADNSYFCTFVDILRPHTHRMRQTWQHDPERRLDAQEAYTEHSEILRNVRERNHDGTIAAMRAHIEAVRSRSIAAEGAGEPAHGEPATG